MLNQTGPKPTDALVPRLPIFRYAGPTPAPILAPQEDTETGPKPDETPTPLVPTCTRAIRGPTEARAPPRPTRTFAIRGPTLRPLVLIRIPGAILNPNPTSPSLFPISQVFQFPY